MRTRSSGARFCAELGLAVDVAGANAQDQDSRHLLCVELAIARLRRSIGTWPALGLVLRHQRGEHARLLRVVVDRFEDAVHLHAAIERRRRAGALGVDEVARDRRDHVFGGSTAAPSERLHLLADGGGRGSRRRRRRSPDAACAGAARRPAWSSPGERTGARGEERHRLAARHAKEPFPAHGPIDIVRAGTFERSSFVISTRPWPNGSWRSICACARRAPSSRSSFAWRAPSATTCGAAGSSRATRCRAAARWRARSASIATRCSRRTASWRPKVGSRPRRRRGTFVSHALPDVEARRPTARARDGARRRRQRRPSASTCRRGATIARSRRRAGGRAAARARARDVGRHSRRAAGAVGAAGARVPPRAQASRRRAARLWRRARPRAAARARSATCCRRCAASPPTSTR